MMENMMEYKGYIAAVSYDSLAEVLCGSVVNAGSYSFATFEATDVKQLRKEFEISVEDYLDWCKEDGVEPTKPYYGKLQSPAAKRNENIMDAQPVVLVGEHVRLEPSGSSTPGICTPSARMNPSGAICRVRLSQTWTTRALGLKAVLPREKREPPSSSR